MISPVKINCNEHKFIRIISSSGNVFSYLLKPESFEVLDSFHSFVPKKDLIKMKVLEAHRIETNSLPLTLEQPVIDFSHGTGDELITFIRDSLGKTFWRNSTKGKN